MTIWNCTLWRDNLDGKRDKPDEEFGARDLIKMY
jgi:hypothetical protein